MDAKGNISEYKANAGFSNTGNKIKFPVDAGLYALSQAYAGLNFLYTDANTPNWVTYEQLAAIDLSVIPESDLNFTLEDGVIKNWAAQPYEIVTYNGEIVTYLGEKVTSIKTHLIT